MRTSWHWASGICGVFLVQTASAAEADATPPVLPNAEHTAPAPAPAPLAAPAPAPPAAPAATSVAASPAQVSWAEPAEPSAEPPAAPPRRKPPRENWYGGQIILSDVTTLLLAGLTDESAIGFVGYFGVPPLIHVLHGENVRALASVGLRVALPLAGYAVALEGIKTCSSSDEESIACGIGWVVIGFAIGLGGMGLDAAFAYEPVQPAEHARLRLTPQVMISEHGTRFGLMGSF